MAYNTPNKDQKVQKLGAAVVQVEADLIAEGKAKQAKQLVKVFAEADADTMAKLVDIMLIGHLVQQEAVDAR